ncbi:eRF1 domain 1-domain-containing protein [Sphaerosporella brunnea]|uniref:Protein DOM34 homolog n=1 Tax=Sphaerosporella brunnea TaxID=1250544 RepID=A0A5J5F908_9PEZI|nr:eRF1 domain 1-domain-containing protein [Sphaerosporella brunnea]
MKLIRKNLEKDGEGSITMCPEEDEDMWHAYNLIRPHDILRASALRKVSTTSSTGSVASQRVQLTLTITVDKIDFDAAGGALHISGRVLDENKYVPIGAHHTLDLELHRNFTLSKTLWDSVALETVRAACAPGENADIAAIVLHEGLACICAVTEHTTIERQRIEMSVPKKRSPEAHERGMERFYKAITEAFLRLFEIDKLKAVLLGSPGFYAAGLRDYIFSFAEKTENKPLLRARPKFIVEHTSSGHKHALTEALTSPAVKAKLADTRYAKEMEAVDAFFRMIHTDEFRAWYGAKEVAKAVEKGAVGTLLLSDSLFRSQSVAERRKFVAMKEEVERQGGEVLILSSIHESGVRLGNIGGIAAILTFPLEDLDEDEELELEEPKLEEDGGGQN